MASNRISVDSLQMRPEYEENEDFFLKSPTSLQKELAHKLHEAKKLKDNYYENWKKIENKCIKLEEENHYLQSLIEKKHPSKPNHKMLDNESPNSSVIYAVNILSKQVTKVTNTFALQDRIFKSCIENLETNVESSQKIHEKVDEYIETCKANDLHMQKIIHHNENFKESFSEILRTENSSPGFGYVAPSLYDEIKDFEINNQKNDNFVLISEAKLCRLNGLKKLLKNLREEVYRITRFEGRKLRVKDKIIRKGMLGFTTVLNF